LVSHGTPKQTPRAQWPSLAPHHLLFPTLRKGLSAMMFRSNLTRSLGFLILASAVAPELACQSTDETDAESGAATAFSPKALGVRNGAVGELSPSEALGLRFVSYGKVLTWEGIVVDIGKPSAKVHLVDTKKFEGHFGYARDGLGQAGMTQEQFFTKVQFPDSRIYMPFLAFDFRAAPLTRNGKRFNWVMNVRRYNYKDSDQQLADMLVNLRKLLSENLMAGFGEPLLYVYNNPNSFRRPRTDKLVEVKKAGFEVITEDEMIRDAGGELVSVLNPGTAMGYLKRIPAGDTTTRLTPKDILRSGSRQ
jgi:hypothetical protein